MNFLLDENFPKSAVELLTRSGHRVFDSRELAGIGATDERIVRVALENSAVVLTTDRDFFHTLGRRIPSHHGIVVIALRQPNRDAILKRLEWFLENGLPESLPDRVFQLRDHTWMVYPPI